MKNFINMNDLRLQKTDMQKLVGGCRRRKRVRPLYGIEPVVKYGIIPLYGIQPLYGIIVPEPQPLYAVVVAVDE